MEAALTRFQAAHTQVLGVSIDSVHSHANWGHDLEGISFPLLSDFEPKGAVARSYGAYLGEAGVTDRATVIIDSSGIVRYAVSVSPSGERDIGELAQLCERVDQKYAAPERPPTASPSLPSDTVLYVKSNCGFSRAALLARHNLHLADALPVRNVTDHPAAADELLKLTGGNQAPCLVTGGSALHESGDIIRALADAAAPLT